ncbi:FHA domain-containing protein [Azoarcus sp. KH32C]|uniref:FHA domain-containing protein n=1 Tax=Azoarcus sp. KH32C TaxID=748247 RepID=UPI0002386ABF|nr:FHA domain-containing protein [Azoarcus sp. KH32C]BAL25963.1 FHA domain-containing protein [Azoarcus sp. KH32C]
MPKLILSMDGLVLKEIPLDRERISIGRKASNDIQIDNLAISGQHAVITTILDDAFLEDQNSTNGTYVNGQPVKKCVLHNNDVIELGKYRLKYLAERARALPASDYAPSPAAKRAPAPQDVPSSAHETQQLPPEVLTGEAPECSFDETQVGVVNVLNGPNAGRELVLNKALTTLGKPGKQVAVITRRQHGYVIAHGEGAERPQVNGRAIEPAGHLLDHGDVIEIAGVRMAFALRRAS